MARRPPKKDILDVLSNFFAHYKGLPVLVGVGLAFVGLVLALIPGLALVEGVGGWLARSHLFLYLGVIVGLVGVLLGDAL